MYVTSTFNINTEHSFIFTISRFHFDDFPLQSSKLKFNIECIDLLIVTKKNQSMVASYQT